MNLAFCSPFATTKSRQFEKIESEGEGFVYLQKTGGLSPLENPSNDQEREKQLADLSWIILSAIRRVAAELNVTTQQAREILFGTKVKASAEAVEKSADENSTEADTGEAKAIVKTSVDFSGVNADDYLTREELDALQGMKTSRIDVAKISTTKLMKYRMAYALEITEAPPTTLNDQFQLNVTTSFFAAPGASVFLCNGGQFKLRKPLSIGDTVAYFEPALMPPNEKLKAGEPIFLADPATKLEKIGYEDWSAAHTETVPYSLIFKIREFLEREVTGAALDPTANADSPPEGEQENDDELGNSPKDSKTQKTERSSIGSGSTSASNTSDAATPG